MNSGAISQAAADALRDTRPLMARSIQYIEGNLNTRENLENFTNDIICQR